MDMRSFQSIKAISCSWNGLEIIGIQKACDTKKAIEEGEDEHDTFIREN